MDSVLKQFSNKEPTPEGKRAFGDRIKKHRLPHVLVNIENGTTLSKADEIPNDVFTPLEIGTDQVQEVKETVDKDDNKKRNDKKKDADKTKKVDSELLNKLKSQRHLLEQNNTATRSKQSAATTGHLTKEDGKLVDTNRKRVDDIEDDMENPVEGDAIKKIISQMKQLAMRKGQWKLKKFLKLSSQFVDTKFASKVTNSNCAGMFADNSNMQIRMRLSGETWPPYIIYKFISISDNNSMLPQLNPSNYGNRWANNITFISSSNPSSVIKNVQLDIGLKDNVKNQKQSSNSNKEEMIKVQNLKDNQYRQIFTQERYVPIRGNLIKRNEKLKKDENLQITKLPFENTHKLPSIPLSELRPYKKKLLKNNVMTELYVDLSKTENNNRTRLNQSLGSIPKKILKQTSNVLYYNTKFQTLEKLTNRNKHTWGKKTIEDDESTETRTVNNVTRTEQMENEKIQWNQNRKMVLRMNFMNEQKEMWKQMASPQIIHTNKFIENKFVKEYFSEYQK